MFLVLVSQETRTWTINTKNTKTFKWFKWLLLTPYWSAFALNLFLETMHLKGLFPAIFLIVGSAKFFAKPLVKIIFTTFTWREQKIWHGFTSQSIHFTNTYNHWFDLSLLLLCPKPSVFTQLCTPRNSLLEKKQLPWLLYSVPQRYFLRQLLLNLIFTTIYAHFFSKHGFFLWKWLLSKK